MAVSKSVTSKAAQTKTKRTTARKKGAKSMGKSRLSAIGKKGGKQSSTIKKAS